MNKHMKYSLLVVLAFAMMISIVRAPPLPIGDAGYLQTQPYESNPTAHTATGVTSVSWANTYDGDLDTLVNFWGTGTVTTANVYFRLFDNTPPADFAIGQVDLKIKYKFPGTTSNTYRIEYSLDGTTWTVIQAATTAKFDNGGQPGIRPFVNIARPGGGSWTWADIALLRVRFFLTRVVSTWDTVNKIGLYETWLTIYENPPPTDVGPVVSVWPSSVLGVPTYGFFYVDLYIRNVASLWGYQFTMHYDTNVLTALEYFSYYIFDTVAVSYIDDPNGIVSVSYSSFGGDLVGFTGDAPLARIYFMVDGGGSTTLDIPPAESILSDTTGNAIDHTVQGGWFSSGIIMSFTGGMLAPADPTGTLWHEDYPTYSTPWALTSWIDNGDDFLSPSDQIDMTSPDHPGLLYWYHVDIVTTTIHFTFKAPDTGAGVAESEIPMETMPGGDPTDTRYHMIYPDYCRTFTITSWTDNGDGNFTPSDQFDFLFDDEYDEFGNPGPIHWAHLDSVTTDIIVSLKSVEPGVPEFPFGISLVFAVAPLVAMVYLWRIKPRKKVD